MPQASATTATARLAHTFAAIEQTPSASAVPVPTMLVAYRDGHAIVTYNDGHGVVVEVILPTVAIVLAIIVVIGVAWFVIHGFSLSVIISLFSSSSFYIFNGF